MHSKEKGVLFSHLRDSFSQMPPFTFPLSFLALYYQCVDLDVTRLDLAGAWETTFDLEPCGYRILKGDSWVRDLLLIGLFGSLGQLPRYYIGVSFVLAELYDIRRGVSTHIQKIDAAILEKWIERLSLPEQCGHPQHCGWRGFFDTLFRSTSVRHKSLLFTLDDSLRLSYEPTFCTFDSISWIRIRMVGIKGKKCCTDPIVSMID